MRQSFLLFLTFLAVPHAGLAAEPDPLHLAGSRVRIQAPDKSTAAGRLLLGGRKQAGTVVEMRGDTLLFTADGQSTPALVPTESLTGLEVSRGMHSHVLAGAGLGFLAGALVGGVIGYASLHEGPPYSDGDYGGVGAVSGAAIGGGVGIGVGAIVGSRRTERWETLGLPISIGFLPSTDTIGLSLAFTIM